MSDFVPDPDISLYDNENGDQNDPESSEEPVPTSSNNAGNVALQEIMDTSNIPIPTAHIMAQILNVKHSIRVTQHGLCHLDPSLRSQTQASTFHKEVIKLQYNLAQLQRSISGRDLIPQEVVRRLEEGLETMQKRLDAIQTGIRELINKTR